MAYLQDNHHLVPQQSAYRRHHSSKTAMLKIASDVFDAANAGHVTILALLDLSAALDTVDHDILLQRLNQTYGIGGTVLHWVRSFLSGQVLVVHFAGQHSKESPLLYGLPQGSVSGPILFSLYTADVVRIAQSFGMCIHCYANDLQPYVHCHVGDAEVAAARLLACISAIDKWIRSNRLKMNPDKIQFIWLGSRQQLAHLNITPLHLHGGTIVVPSTDVRSLGFVFDSLLSITNHVNHVTRACVCQLRRLRFIRDSLTDDAATNASARFCLQQSRLL